MFFEDLGIPEGLAIYQRKRERKRAIYESTGTPFVELVAEDFLDYRWEEKLGQAVAGIARKP